MIVGRENVGDDFWPMRFALIIWWPWRWRTSRVSKAEDEIPTEPINFLFLCFEKTEKVIMKDAIVFGDRKYLKTEKIIIK